MKATDTTTLGGRIRFVRQNLPGRVNMEKFGAMLGGISAPAINSYELNNVVPSTSTIALICREFNISRVWLETGEEPMSIAPETPDEFVDEKLASGSEFAKALLRVIARMPDEDLQAVERLFSALRDEMKKSPD